MDTRLPIRQPSLADQVLQILSQRIKDQSYPPGSRLPPENHLAEEFSVSRATVRSALDMLAASGMIVRRQGVGTFISRLSTISNPLNEFIDFNDLIRDNGFKPGFQQIQAALLEPELKVADKLQLKEHSRVLNIHKVFTADGDPIIYVINNIPEWVFQDILTEEEAVQPGLTEPFFEFFEKICGQQLLYSISSIQTASFRTLDLLHTLDIDDPHSPFLIVDDIGFNQEGRPTNQSIEYHPGNRMNFDIIRHRGQRTLPG
jgi:GntR family transcriptional regulator